MQLICEGHPQIRGLSEGLRLVLQRPTVLDEPVLQGDSDADASGASIYGSVVRDGGVFRMWYQAWPRDWDGTDVISVGCAESDDGVTWRRPSYGLISCCGTKENHLTDLPFHSPSVFIDPDADASARYRAFGCTGPQRLGGRYPHQINGYGYHTAHSADGLRWTFDLPEPIWPKSDVIVSAWDPYAGCARIALKNNGHAAGMYRRRFYTAEWSRGKTTEPVAALIPDEYDDLGAKTRGFNSADYYGVGWMPTPGLTVGFLWNFRHQLPLGHNERLMIYSGGRGRVDVSVVYQIERGGRWLHVPGRPDWLCAEDAPDWARGAVYTASSALDVGDETWLYFTGTHERHGWCGHGQEIEAWRRQVVAERRGFAKIGLARWPRNRVMGYEALLLERIHLSPRVEPGAEGRLVLNAVTRPGGRIRAGLLDTSHQPIPGYGLDDSDVITGNYLEVPVRWRRKFRLPGVSDGQAINAQIEIIEGAIYAFDFVISTR